jgi:Yip1-like protein
MNGEPDPHWIGNAARAVGREIAAYAATAWTILRSPRRFATEWSDGTRAALNPLAFLLNALAVLGPWRALWARLLDPNPPTTPLWFEIGKPVLPVVGNIIGMGVCHALMRLFGGRRPLRTSLAMAFYISGGPMFLFGMLASPLTLYAFLHRQSLAVALASAFVNISVFVAFIVYTVITLRAVHRLSRWRTVVAVLVAWILYGGFWGWLSFVRPALVRSMMSG